MRHKFFGEPNLQIMDSDTGNPLFKFDDKGELILSDDNPFLKRMTAHYGHEPVEEVKIDDKPAGGHPIQPNSKRVGSKR